MAHFCVSLHAPCHMFQAVPFIKGYHLSSPLCAYTYLCVSVFADLCTDMHLCMATHSSLLAWKILWTEEPAAYSPLGLKKLDITEHAHYLYTI